MECDSDVVVCWGYMVLVTFLMYFVRCLLWRLLCSVGVYGFGRLVVIYVVCVFVLTVCMGRFGGYSECVWVCNGCVGFVWLEWCLTLWMGCSIGGGWCRSVLE